MKIECIEGILNKEQEGVGEIKPNGEIFCGRIKTYKPFPLVCDL